MSRSSVRIVDDVSGADGIDMARVADAPHDLEGTIAWGVVDGDESSAMALDRALRGATLVLVVTLDSQGRADFLDQLRRVAEVEVEVEVDVEARPIGLTADHVALLRELRAGASLHEAARSASMSTRTAARRLSELRVHYGVATVAELLALVED